MCVCARARLLRAFVRACVRASVRRGKEREREREKEKERQRESLCVCVCERGHLGASGAVYETFAWTICNIYTLQKFQRVSFCLNGSGTVGFARPWASFAAVVVSCTQTH